MKGIAIGKRATQKRIVTGQKTKPFSKMEVCEIVQAYFTKMQTYESNTPIDELYTALKCWHIELKMDYFMMRRELRDYRERYLDAIRRLTEIEDKYSNLKNTEAEEL